MKKIKRILRVFFVALIFALAMAGIGLPGSLFTGNKDELQNRRPRIDNVQRREEDEPD